MPKISGIHHYSIKCLGDEAFARVLHFYHEVLGMPIARSWETGALLDSGSGMVEVFHNGVGETGRGAIRHIAFEVDDVDGWTEVVRQAGYEVFMEPKDIELPVHARIAFCFGPVGEEVEFFRPY